MLFLAKKLLPFAPVVRLALVVSWWGDKHFCIERGGDNIFFGCGGSYDDVDEEIDVSEASFLVSEANIFVSEASKLSAGARIFRGP